MAVFKLQLSDGNEKIVEAGRAARTAAGRILIEDTDETGCWALLEAYDVADVESVMRRGPAEGGIYTWIPQPSGGRWWVY